MLAVNNERSPGKVDFQEKKEQLKGLGEGATVSFHIETPLPWTALKGVGLVLATESRRFPLSFLNFVKIK